MKKSNRNIERNIVDRLQKHEFEFDPKAWEQMEAMLDDEPKRFWAAFQTNSGAKIIAGVFLLLLFGMSIYYILPATNNSANELTKNQMVEENADPRKKALNKNTLQADVLIEDIESKVKSNGSESLYANTPDETALNTQKHSQKSLLKQTTNVEKFVSVEFSSNFVKSDINRGHAKSELNINTIAELKLNAGSKKQAQYASINESYKAHHTLAEETKSENIDKATSEKIAGTKKLLSETKRALYAVTKTLNQSAFSQLLVNERNDVDVILLFEKTKTLKKLQRKWAYGIFAGVHQGLDYTNTRKNELSGIIGLFLERKLSNSWGLQFQLNMKKTPNLNSSVSFENFYETPTSLFKTEVNYSFVSSDVLELPLLVTKKINKGKLKIMAGVKYARILGSSYIPYIDQDPSFLTGNYGAQLDNNNNDRLIGDYNLQGNAIFELDSQGYSGLNLNEASLSNNFNGINKDDFSLVAAIGYRFTKRWSLDLRFDQGLVDITPINVFQTNNFDSSNSLHLLLKYHF